MRECGEEMRKSSEAWHLSKLARRSSRHIPVPTLDTRPSCTNYPADGVASLGRGGVWVSACSGRHRTRQRPGGRSMMQVQSISQRS
ncbi:hypothetical protein O3P69_007487 [Scylla paramamosain]|uniref:Uncharacterized protein n=1 Tax=Scylla paramamosain TaxID=85552 RepID=A0AAW0V634_SCYPA